MNYLTSYENFVLDNTNIANSIFAIGCFSGLLNTKLKLIRKNPFIPVLNAIVNGIVYKIFGEFLIWLFPKSRYVMIPILTLSTFAILFKNNCLKFSYLNGTYQKYKRT